MKRIGTALVWALLGLVPLFLASGPSAGAARHSDTTTLTLTAGKDASSARPFTFQAGTAYDITVSGTLTYNFTNSTPPTTCVHDVFFDQCEQTGTEGGSWQRQDLLEVFDDPHQANTDSALPGANTTTVTFHPGHSYSWVVPGSTFAKDTKKYFWAQPWGGQETYTTTYSGQVTVTIKPHEQQDRFGVRFTVVGLPKDPPQWLKDVTLAGQGRIHLSFYSSRRGDASNGTGHWRMKDVEEIRLGSGTEHRRTIKLAATDGRGSILNLEAGGERATFGDFKVTDSDDPHCKAGMSRAGVVVIDGPKVPDEVRLRLHCETARTEHTFKFDFVNGRRTHVTTAIVGPQ